MYKALKNYIHDISFLIDKEPPTTPEDLAHPSQKGYMVAVAEFASNHIALSEAEVFNFQPVDGFDEIMTPLQLPEKITTFSSSIGKAVFECHFTVCLSLALRGVEDCEVKVSVAEAASILKREKIDDIFPFLVITPGPAALALEAKGFEIVDGVIDISNLAHNILRANLDSFVGSTRGAQAVPIACMRKAGANDIDQVVPWNSAKVYLDVVVIARTVACLGARVHTDFLMGGAKNQAMDRLDLFANLLKGFGDSLTTLDLLLHHESIATLEADDWHFRTSFTSWKLWQGCMAILRGKAVTVWQQLWVTVLGGLASRVKSIPPAWETVFESGVLNRQRAASMIKGKYSQLVAGHTSVHTMLTRMNAGAEVVEVSPVMSKHPLTEAAIAEALHTMDKLCTAACVVSGLDILTTYQYHHLGPNKADKFLAGCPTDKRCPAIPQLFWDELASLKADSYLVDKTGSEAQRPIVKAETSPEVKTEQHQASAAASNAGSPSAVKQETVKGGPRLKRLRPLA